MTPLHDSRGASGIVPIDWRGRRVDIEHAWVGVDDPGAPAIVFLHEGLGSLAMWKDFPERLCRQVGARGLVYSRPGYGRSTPRAADERWSADFMHRQAFEVLPALMEALDLAGQPNRHWLFGHSDGGSISLLYAARHVDALAGCIVLAPHILVEDVSVQSIRLARDAYLNTDLKRRLSRYHDDPDSAFFGWNDVWLSQGFRGWSIESEIGSIQCPLLAVQGLGDEYGSIEQIRGIARRLPHTQLLELADCGHSPHKDQPEALLKAVQRFFDHHRRSA